MNKSAVTTVANFIAHIVFETWSKLEWRLRYIWSPRQYNYKSIESICELISSQLNSHEMSQTLYFVFISHKMNFGILI